MAGKKKDKEVVPLTREEQIAKAKADFRGWKGIPPGLVANPTRHFVPGDTCQVGNLDNCVIAEVLLEGKAYVVEFDRVDRVDRVDRDSTLHGFGAWWWFSVELDVVLPFENVLFRPYRRGQVSSCDIGSLIGMYGGDGLVCNPEYQRGYVWNDFDREQLLESVFDRLEIGAFTFVRNQGYNQPNNVKLTRYITLEGNETYLPHNENHTIEIIDGQQRATTLIRFFLDMFPFKGKYFSQMNRRDQIDFEGFSISYRIINAEDITRKELLEMFLQVNRGVPQQKEHLDLVRALYDAES